MGRGPEVVGSLFSNNFEAQQIVTRHAVFTEGVTVMMRTTESDDELKINPLSKDKLGYLWSYGFILQIK